MSSHAGMSTPSRPGHIRHGSLSGSTGSYTGNTEGSPMLGSNANPTSPSPAAAAFSPGGAIAPGYSYLTRSHSLVTPTRRSVPTGMGSSSSITNVKDASSSRGPLPALPPSASAPDVARDAMLRRNHSFGPTSSSSHHRDITPTPATAASRAAEEIASARGEQGSAESKQHTLTRTKSEASTLAAMVAQLPANPKQWTPSQVALYLSHVLGLTPRPIVEDVTAYVRRSRMGGRVFLRLREADLEAEGLNYKWRKLMLEATKRLRRDCLRGRIWGFEGGNMEWPRAEDVPEQPEEDDAQQQAEQANIGSKSTTSASRYAAGTLKRLRDRKQTQALIQSFETATESGAEDDEGFVALGHGGGRSSSGSGGRSAALDSPRQPMPPIYGEGFVKRRTESYSSLREAAEEHAARDASSTAPRRQDKQQQLEDWFGTLSDQELAAAASELGESDFGETDGEGDDEAAALPALHTLESSQSTASGSEVSTPPPIYTQLSADVVEALVGPLDALELEQHEPAVEPQEHGTFRMPPSGSKALPIPAAIVLHETEDEPVAEAPLRRRVSGKANPYRASTYAPEDLEALGFNLAGDESPRFGTARKIRRPSAEQMGDASADSAVEADTEADDEEDIGDTLKMPLSAPAAAQEEPVQPASPVQQQNASPSELRGTMSRAKSAATTGRKAGTLSRAALANMVANTSTPTPAAPAGLSEFNSATSTPTATSKGAARMLELFNPVSIDDAEASPIKGTADTDDYLSVPLTTLAPSPDGKGSIRKRSMILVERKRFESLARRMGVLENQLANLESMPNSPALGAASDADLGSVTSNATDRRGRNRTALEDVFTYPMPEQRSSAQQEQERLLFDEAEAQGENLKPGKEGWFGAMLSIGAIPSYALGLGAGIGFVLMSEVLGRAARGGH